MENENKNISLSIVSHGQAALVALLLQDIERLNLSKWINEIIITCNVPERYDFKCDSIPLKIINNSIRKGFSENHNAAFKHAKGKYFCVLNPDIRLIDDPFKSLIASIELTGACMVAPLVVDTNNVMQDSVRYFPTIRNTCLRFFKIDNAIYPLISTTDPYKVDWVAGMFMLFRYEVFEDIDGFDEKYFLYYEDVDLCVRLWNSGHTIMVSPMAKVIHTAQRKSHEDFKYLRWHISSLTRYFLKHGLRISLKKYKYLK